MIHQVSYLSVYCFILLLATTLSSVQKDKCSRSRETCDIKPLSAGRLHLAQRFFGEPAEPQAQAVLSSYSQLPNGFSIPAGTPGPMRRSFTSFQHLNARGLSDNATPQTIE